MKVAEMKQFLKREYGLDDDQITAVLEDEWTDWLPIEVGIA